MTCLRTMQIIRAHIRTRCRKECLGLNVEHLWFTVVGLAVALFKFVSDSALWRRTFALRLWPGFVTLLGVLLVFYTE